MPMDSVTPRERAVQKLRRAAIRASRKRRVEHVVRADRSSRVGQIVGDLTEVSLGRARLVEVDRRRRSKNKIVLVVEKPEAAGAHRENQKGGAKARGGGE